MALVLTVSTPLSNINDYTRVPCLSGALCGQKSGLERGIPLAELTTRSLKGERA